MEMTHQSKPSYLIPLTVAVLALPALLFLASPPINAALLLAYELVAQIGICALLLNFSRAAPGRFARPGMRALFAFSIAFGVAELCFNGSLVAGSIAAYRAVCGASLLYTVAFTSLAFAVWRHFGRRREPASFYFSAACLVGAHYFLQYKFILQRLGPSYFEHLPAFILPNSYAYSLATSVVAALAVLYSLRTEDTDAHLWLQSILALLAFDFAQRFQIVESSFSKTTFAQPLWSAGIGALGVAFWRCARNAGGIFSEAPALAPWSSVRVMLGVFVFGANTLLFFGSLATGLFAVQDAEQVTMLLAVLFATWCLSNLLASRVSRDLHALAAAMPSPAASKLDADAWAKLALQPISKRAQFSEINALLRHYNILLATTNEMVQALIKKDREAAVGRLATQVAHDIRSPLAALRMGVAAPRQGEEARSLVRNAIFRIEDIANTLLEKKTEVDTPSSSVEPLLLSSLVDSLVSEKRVEYRAQLNMTIENRVAQRAYGLFAAVDAANFKRVLSNLINNAVEAARKHAAGMITVEVSGDEQSVWLDVQDNGVGIPADILSRLGGEDALSAKAGGHGLGVSHASKMARQWGGSLSFRSEPNKGTLVRMALPRAAPPPWFVDRLPLQEVSTVVIVDDDSSIHQVWRERLGKLAGIALVNLATLEQLRAWHDSSAQSHSLYLIDYEFAGAEETGLEFITRNALASHAVLVTSRFEENQLRQRAAQLGVRVIPKSAAAYVPIDAPPTAGTAALQQLHLVLIDDDPLVRQLWEAQAAWHGKALRTYAHVEAFWLDAPELPKSTSVYIDSQLSDGFRGEDLVERIAKLGFEQIYLATGRSAADFGQIAGLTGIVGKEGPFA